MKILIQRVTEACVAVSGNTVGAIDHGLLALIGFDQDDSQKSTERMLHRLLHYRVFEDSHDKMNLNIQDVEGGLLLVPQFTLTANTQKGHRPSFSTCMPPAQAKKQFDDLVQLAKTQYTRIETGEFGANMQVSLINDGPVTFLLEG